MECEGCSLRQAEAGLLFNGDFYRLLSWLQKHGVLPRERRCPKCTKPCTLTARYRTGKVISFVCSSSHFHKGIRRRCNYVRSLYHGTVFSNTTLPSVGWLLILWATTDNYTFEYLIRESALCRYPVYYWSAFCRDLCINWFDKNHPDDPIDLENFEKHHPDFKAYGQIARKNKGYICEYLWRKSIPKISDRAHSLFTMIGQVKDGKYAFKKFKSVPPVGDFE